MDALHVIVGVLLQLVAAALFRTVLARWLPWLAVFGLALLNESMDLAVERWPHLGMQLGEGSKDLLLTMALPTLLMLSARYCPTLITEARRSE